MALAVLIAALAHAACAQTIAGDFPHYAFPRARAELADIWTFVRALGAAPEGAPPPLLYFSRFDPLAQAADWTAWQRQWTTKHPEIYEDARKAGVTGDFPFPASFRAYHYDGTERIQLDPKTTFLAFYQNGPDGLPRDFVGLGYYVAGHEMLHYVLELAGVPGKRHHCLFVTPRGQGPSYMEALADFLIARGYSSFAVKRYGLGQELALDPCGDPDLLKSKP